MTAGLVAGTLIVKAFTEQAGLVSYMVSGVRTGKSKFHSNLFQPLTLLELVATGSGSLTGAAITDPIPAGTTYVPGSLTLNAVSLSDVADADAGSVAAGTVTVNLGTVTAPATNTVTFQVTIN